MEETKICIETVKTFPDKAVDDETRKRAIYIENALNLYSVYQVTFS